MGRLSVTAARTARALAVSGAAGLLLFSGMLPAAAAATNLSASGSGANESPAALATDTVAGTFAVDADAGSFTYTVSFQGGETAAAGHIHKGAVGANGDVVIPLDAAVINAGGTATVTADKALLADIAANPAGYYVNVHTATYPKGAARGQLTAGTGTTPTAVNAGTGGQFAASNSGMSGATVALLVGGALVLIGGAGVLTARRRNS